MPKYVEFTETPEGLVVTLLAAGRDLLLSYQVDAADDRWKKGTDDIVRELYDWQYSNGWADIAPDHIGAMTNSLILSPDATWPDDADGYVLLPGAKVYWQPNYAVEDELRELLEQGSFTYTLARDE